MTKIRENDRLVKYHNTPLDSNLRCSWDWIEPVVFADDH